MEENDSTKIIAKHLAQVKLEAAEIRYDQETYINSLKNNLEDAMKLLEVNRLEIENYRNQIKEVQAQNTYKILAAEREQWKKLIDTLRQDKKQLQVEVGTLRDQISKGYFQNKTETIVNGSCGLETNEFDAVCSPAQIKLLNAQLETKDFQIDGLRKKLDAELEIKWEQSHKQSPKFDNANKWWHLSLFERLSQNFTQYSDDESVTSSSSESPCSNKSEEGEGENVETVPEANQTE